MKRLINEKFNYNKHTLLTIINNRSIHDRLIPFCRNCYLTREPLEACRSDDRYERICFGNIYPVARFNFIKYDRNKIK